MFYDLASFSWWLLAVALTGVIVGWVTYADIPRRGWFEGWAIWGAVAFVIGLVIAVLKLLPGEAGLWLEIALLAMFLYVLGCFLGGWLKSMRPRPARQRAEEAAQTGVALNASSKVEADRLAEQQDQPASEDAAKAETDRSAAAAKAEQDHLAEQAAAKAEAEHRAAAAQAEQARLAAEVAAKAEAERRDAAAKAEQDRLAAEAAAKAEAERRDAAAKAEQDRLAAEAVAKAEAEHRDATEKAEQDRLVAEAEAERHAAAAQAEQDRSAAETAAEAERQATAAAAPGIRPPALGAPQGAADDLKLIKGIGPNNERTLNGLGVYHFSQISDWSPDHASWIGHQMAFAGRIERESWIPQAKLLAAGFDTDHSAGVKSGVIIIDDSADAPMSEAEAHSLAAGMPALMPAVEGEDRHPGARPLGLAAPHGGVADDLKRIKRIGKQNEARLRGLGVWHFDQIAAWSAENVKWVGSYLAFAGRIERERWIAQAKDLATGRNTEFARSVETGLAATSRDDGSGGQGNVEELEPKSD
jgi:predicted flap endonuclease-1-like 5' DNA nuclease